MGCNDKYMDDLEWALWFSSEEQINYRLNKGIRASDEDWARYDKMVAQASKIFTERTGIRNYGDKPDPPISISGE